MTDCPIFDAVLAESDPDIFLASTVFPNGAPESLAEALTLIGHPQSTDTGATP